TLGAIGSVTCSGTLPATCTAAVTYTANTCASGADSFTYRANDGTSKSAPAPVGLAMFLNSPPNVTLQPTNTTVHSSYCATFQSAATGCNPTVQWQASSTGGSPWTNIPGATATTYSFVTTDSDSGRWFRAMFTNSSGSLPSIPAMWTVVPATPLNRGDFTGDGKADLIFQHPSTGAVLLWEMNGAT